MGVLLYLMVILSIPPASGQDPGEFLRAEEFLAAVLSWPGSNKEMNLHCHFLQLPAPERHSELFRAVDCVQPRAERMCGAALHSPVGVTEDGHDLLHHGRVHHVAVGEQHLVHLAGRGLADLQEGQGQHCQGRAGQSHRGC